MTGVVLIEGVSAAPPGVLALVGRSLVEFGRMVAWLAPLAALSVLATEGLDRALKAVHFRGAIADGAEMATLFGIAALQLTAAMSRVLSRLRGERLRLHQTLWTAVRRLVPVGVATVVLAAAVLAGLAALVVPGLVALGSLAVAPAAAVDGPGGPWRAIVRALDLTRGYRARAVAVLAVVTALAILALAAFAFALQSWESNSNVGALAGISVATLLASLPPIGATVVYEALREAKEAPQEAELARVFG